MSEIPSANQIDAAKTTLATLNTIRSNILKQHPELFLDEVHTFFQDLVVPKGIVAIVNKKDDVHLAVPHSSSHKYQWLSYHGDLRSQQLEGSFPHRATNFENPVTQQSSSSQLNPGSSQVPIDHSPLAGSSSIPITSIKLEPNMTDSNMVSTAGSGISSYSRALYQPFPYTLAANNTQTPQQHFN